MKVTVVYRDNTDYARAVTDFLHDFEHQTGHILDEIDPDTAQGISFCETYGIVSYPTVIATNDTGMLQNAWNGLPLPTISEVSFYVQQS